MLMSKSNLQRNEMMRGDCGDKEVKNEKLKIENADCAISIFFSLNKTIGLNSGIDYSIKMKFDWPQCSLTCYDIANQ